jgi:imidazolonepropionase-like amidohydrolase
MTTPLPTEETSRVLITDANVFDGTHEKPATGVSVLVEGNKITKVAKSITAPDGAMVIDAQGRTLTPGFIGAHEHLIGQVPFNELTNDTRYMAYAATKTAQTYLMKGFTAVRDVAANSYSLKKAIDQGIIVGPRVYPSGPMISQTSGHADHRLDTDDSALYGGTWDPMVRWGDMVVVDGVPEMLKAVRENLRRGATQI